MDDRELLWRQYELNVDLYKHYLKLSIEFNIFYYAITGAILSYYLNNFGEGLLKFALLLPAMMGITFAVFFVYAAKLMRVSRHEVFEIRDSLGLSASPDLGVLSLLLYIFAGLLAVVGTSIGWLAFF
ncbi:MAG: hypothetical protein AAGH76_08770 [Pseudomonadota bacterium]